MYSTWSLHFVKLPFWLTNFEDSTYCTLFFSYQLATFQHKTPYHSLKGLISIIIFPDLREHVRQVEKAVATKEPRFMSRALRALVPIRRKLNQNVLRKAVLGYFTTATPPKDGLLNFLEEVRIFGCIHTKWHSDLRPQHRRVFVKERSVYDMFVGVACSSPVNLQCKEALSLSLLSHVGNWKKTY